MEEYLDPRVKAILLEIARRGVAEAEMWEKLFGESSSGEPDPDLREQYRAKVAANEAYRNMVVKDLAGLGHPVHTMTITGFNPGRMDHYTLDKRLQNRFGREVITDSESGQFWAYTTEAIADEALKYLYELAPEGNFVLTPDISAGDHLLGNWSDCRRFLEEHGEE